MAAGQTRFSLSLTWKRTWPAAIAIALDVSGRLQNPFEGAVDVHFASTFGFGIEDRTAAAIRSNKNILRHVAAERIHVELCKLLTGLGANQILRDYPDVLCVFWPELGPLVTLEQHSPWHCWGVWEHMIHAAEAARPDAVLRLAVLLHDIGKPCCKSTDENHHFTTVFLSVNPGTEAHDAANRISLMGFTKEEK